MSNLTEALHHLRAFRDTFNSGDEIDEDTQLTVDDLDVIIEAFEEGELSDDPE